MRSLINGASFEEHEEQIKQEAKDHNVKIEDQSGNQSSSTEDATVEPTTPASNQKKGTESKSVDYSSDLPVYKNVPYSKADAEQIQYLDQGKIKLDKRTLSVINGTAQEMTPAQKELHKMFNDDYMSYLAWQTKTNPIDNKWKEGDVFDLRTGDGEYNEDLIYDLKNDLTVPTVMEEIEVKGLKKEHQWFDHPSADDPMFNFEEIDPLAGVFDLATGGLIDSAPLILKPAE